MESTTSAPACELKPSGARKRLLSCSSSESDESESFEDTKKPKSASSRLTKSLSPSIVPAVKVEGQKDDLRNGRDKKKRRKRRRKMPVVQDGLVQKIDSQPRHDTPGSSTRCSSSTLMTGDGATVTDGTSIERGELCQLPTGTGSHDLTSAVHLKDAINAKPGTSVIHADISLPKVPQETNSEAQTDVEAHIASTPLSAIDGIDSFNPVDKGKGRATEPVIPEQTPVVPVSKVPVSINGTEPPIGQTFSSESSTTDAKSITGDLGAHQALLSALLPSATCRICLYLMHRPFALAPCGHVFCHPCLRAWFSAKVEAPAAPVPAQPAQAPAGAAEEPAPRPPSPPPPPPPRSAVRHKKTCPHCRAVVRERPVEVFVLKEMVTSLIRSGLVEKDVIGESHATEYPGSEYDDPWKDIFWPVNPPGAPLLGMPGLLGEGNAQPRDLYGMRDNEDGGVWRCIDCAHEIWDGICSGCQRIYPGHVDDAFADVYDSEEESDGDMWPGIGGDDLEPEERAAWLAHLLNAAGQGGHGYQPDYDIDVDDHSDADDNEDEDELMRLHFGEDLGSLDGEEDEEEDNDSFIDDGDDSDVQLLDPVEAAEVAVRSRHTQRGRQRRSGIHRAAPIVISSDEEREDEDVRLPSEPPQPSGSRRNDALSRASRSTARRRVVESDDEEDELDADDLAEQVAAHEREVFGDDGSLPSRELRGMSGRLNSAQEHPHEQQDLEDLEREVFGEDSDAEASDNDDDYGEDDMYG